MSLQFIRIGFTNIEKKIKYSMALFKKLKELKEQLKYYEDMIPVNNMGKWGRSVAIQNIKSRIAKIESKIENLKNKPK